MNLNLKVVIIYMAAGTHSIQNDFSHGSRFPCQKVYIHGCRASSLKVLFTWQPFLTPKIYIHSCRASSIKSLFTRQPFLMPKGKYTRLPCIQNKSVIYTAAVVNAKRFIYTTVVHPVYKRYLHGIHCCHASIYTAVIPKAKKHTQKKRSHIMLACFFETKLIY